MRRSLAGNVFSIRSEVVSNSLISWTNHGACLDLAGMFRAWAARARPATIWRVTGFLPLRARHTQVSAMAGMWRKGPETGRSAPGPTPRRRSADRELPGFRTGGGGFPSRRADPGSPRGSGPGAPALRQDLGKVPGMARPRPKAGVGMPWNGRWNGRSRRSKTISGRGGWNRNGLARHRKGRSKRGVGFHTAVTACRATGRVAGAPSSGTTGARGRVG